MLALLMLSVVAIDVISILLLLCRKLLGGGIVRGAPYAARLTRREARRNTPPQHTD